MKSGGRPGTNGTDGKESRDRPLELFWATLLILPVSAIGVFFAVTSHHQLPVFLCVSIASACALVFSVQRARPKRRQWLIGGVAYGGFLGVVGIAVGSMAW